MSRHTKSQWDFGELFPNEPARRVLSVSELTTQIKRLLEKQVGRIWVTGEVTNFRAQSSGHLYFTLKDTGSQVNCVLFRGESVSHREAIEDGQKLILQGDLTVYEPRGQYQLIVRAVELHGMGALQLAFEKLKKKLQAEGLFASERKRALPAYPQRIGLVTSPTGAAIRDVLHVIRRRNPGLEIILAPCRVQGAGAAEEVASAIRLLNEFSDSAMPGEDFRRSQIRRSQTAATGAGGLDLILVTRGGGSLEDLWAFNEEVVARAIFESRLPVVSAIGHEIDFTIGDFVADFRAATPSAAAEIITEGVYASREFLAGAFEDMSRRIRQRLNSTKDSLEELLERVARAHPRRRLNEKLQRLDDLQNGMLRSIKYRRRECQAAWQNVRLRLSRVRPGIMLERRKQSLIVLGCRLHERLILRVNDRQQRLESLEARLRLLSMDNVLARGYSITLDAATGRVIREAAAVRAGQELRTRLKEGEIHSTAAG